MLLQIACNSSWSKGMFGVHLQYGYDRQDMAWRELISSELSLWWTNSRVRFSDQRYLPAEVYSQRFVTSNSRGRCHVPMGARRHGQEGALALPWKCCKVCLCISSYSKTLSRRIIYALFLQSVVGFWRLRLQTLNLPTLGKNPAGSHTCTVEGVWTCCARSCGTVTSPF